MVEVQGGLTMKHGFAAALALTGFLCLGGMAQASTPAPTPEQAARIQAVQAVLDNLHPQSGAVPIKAANATLQLGNDFYFLNAADSRAVLTEVWGNPPSASDGVLGMVFPAGKSPADDTWGAVVTYAGDGYVSDADAHKLDPAKLLETLREGEDEVNRQRQADGYPTTHLAGWAEPPAYDAARHNLIWAKLIAFGDQQDNTLNYDVRVLGRRGVLSMNIVAGADDLQALRPEASRLMATAAFDPGSRYTDFDSSIDKKAEYGIAGLIAGGAALAVAKKVGLLGILLLVAKKG
ncbi:MAG: DUF2167 domain-containing protein, partial [Caulobacteraceae bacterium]|nr:DUF2167 domain-containing protein [Caulobacteraceae bacterium]